MSNLTVHNWDKWQSYRSDRGTPPWIKVHRHVMTSPKWAALSDAEKGQLVSMWIVAADNSGKLPSDPRVIQKVAQLDSQPDISRFIELGFIEPYRRQVDVMVTPDRRQVDPPEENREDKNKNKEEGFSNKIERSFPDKQGTVTTVEDFMKLMDMRAKGSVQ